MTSKCIASYRSFLLGLLILIIPFYPFNISLLVFLILITNVVQYVPLKPASSFSFFFLAPLHVSINSHFSLPLFLALLPVCLSVCLSVPFFCSHAFSSVYMFPASSYLSIVVVSLSLFLSLYCSWKSRNDLCFHPVLCF